MPNALDYYLNPRIQVAIGNQTRRVGGSENEDCRQEILAELYSLNPVDEEEAFRIIERAGKRFRRRLVRHAEIAGAAWDDAQFIPLGDGNYQARQHMHPAD